MADSTYTYPKLRAPLDIQWRTVDQREVLALQCPLGLTDRAIHLVPAVAPVLQLFDGALSTDEIVQRFTAAGLTRELLDGLIRMLDENLFMANARFFAAQEQVRRDFEQSTVREAARAGLVYPREPDELRALVQTYLCGAVAKEKADSTLERRELLCLIAPHIDYFRGGGCYGATYPRMAACDAELYIVIGTSHKYSPRTFHLTAKDFACPLGTLVCDKVFVAQVANRHGAQRAFADEFLHKREHSLELQLPFMAAIKPTARIAPILVGSFHHMIADGRYPHEYDEYESFVGALVEAIRAKRADGGRVCFIAGVDMAHVGRHFGDSDPLSSDGMRIIAERDAKYLEAIRNGDKKALFDHISEDGDARRVCGFPTMYTILDVFSRTGMSYGCEIINYEQAVDMRTDCAVTFAGAAMYSAV
jgi:AmmeMemoRadiSam system protein B